MSDNTLPPAEDDDEGTKVDDRTQADLQTPEARAAAARDAERKAADSAPTAPRPSPPPSASRIPAPPPRPGQQPSTAPPGAPARTTSPSYVPRSPSRPLGSGPPSPPSRPPGSVMRSSAPPSGEDSTRRVMRTGDTTGNRQAPPRVADPGTGGRPAPPPGRGAPQTGSHAALPPRATAPPRPSAPPGSAPSRPPVPSRPVPTSVAELKERIARVVAQLHAERDRIAKQETEIGSLRSRIDRLDARVGELEEDLRERPRSAAADDSLASRVTALEEMAAKLEAGDSALRSILDEQQKAVASGAGAVDELAGRMQALERGMQALEQGMQEVRERQERLVTELREELDARLAEIERLREALETAIEETANLRADREERPAPAGPAVRPTDGAAGDDDLQRIKGIGPKFETALKKAGVRTYAQIAEWTEKDVESIAALIGTRPQRIHRDGWIEHARTLASGT